MIWCEISDWRDYFRRLLAVRGAINVPMVILAVSRYPWEAPAIAQGFFDAIGAANVGPLVDKDE